MIYVLCALVARKRLRGKAMNHDPFYWLAEVTFALMVFTTLRDCL